MYWSHANDIIASPVPTTDCITNHVHFRWKSTCSSHFNIIFIAISDSTLSKVVSQSDSISTSTFNSDISTTRKSIFTKVSVSFDITSVVSVSCISKSIQLDFPTATISEFEFTTSRKFLICPSVSHSSFVEFRASTSSETPTVHTTTNTPFNWSNEDKFIFQRTVQVQIENDVIKTVFFNLHSSVFYHFTTLNSDVWLFVAFQFNISQFSTINCFSSTFFQYQLEWFTTFESDVFFIHTFASSVRSIFVSTISHDSNFGTFSFERSDSRSFTYYIETIFYDCNNRRLFAIVITRCEHHTNYG